VFVPTCINTHLHKCTTLPLEKVGGGGGVMLFVHTCTNTQLHLSKKGTMKVLGGEGVHLCTQVGAIVYSCMCAQIHTFTP
jgi:hypothetical protein